MSPMCAALATALAGTRFCHEIGDRIQVEEASCEVTARAPRPVTECHKLISPYIRVALGLTD
jgi:hypothetical protein